MQIPFKKIAEEKDIKGKRVLLRLDLNVPIVADVVRDDFRIKKSLPTIKMLSERGAKVIIISHIENDLTDSLWPVAENLSKSIKLKTFVSNPDNASGEIGSMENGDVIMIENLRRNEGEKNNDGAFASYLASLADIYVNDAFAVSHREHASIVSLPKLLPAFAGPLFAEEVEELSKAFNPSRPFLFVLGGAKFDTKMPLLQKFLDIADNVFVGGALANDIFREKGYEMGLSLVSKSKINLNSLINHPKLVLPMDVTVSGPMTKKTGLPTEIAKLESIMDAGPRAIDELLGLVNKAKFILWNGPLGDYEKGFSEGTEKLAMAIAKTKTPSVIGGADTIAVVSKMGILEKFGFVSTGGGAMIEFLAKGTLPGIEALRF